MRTGLLVSVFGHVALLAWGVLSLPSPNSLDISNLEAVPVDFIAIEELTRLNLGISTAEAREEIVPEPQAPVVAEVPEPAPEPVPEPEPQPKEAVTEPPTPVPPSRPTPPKTVVAKAETQEVPLTDEIAALLDRTEPTGSSTPPSLGSSTGSPTDRMTVNELDALQARLAKCWNIQLAPPDSSELRVKVKMFLNEDGTLARMPEVLEVSSGDFARSAAESALRAIRRCAPYKLPPEKYASWREIIMNFDPREMFGG